MAIRTFRYRRQEAVELAELNKLIPGSATLVDATGGLVVDYSFEEGNIIDLDEVMSVLGFTNIATDPANPPQSDFSGASFGQHYTYDASENEDSTTLTDYQQKLRMTTATLAAGDYLITWSIRLKSSNNGRIVFAQIELDDTTVLGEYQTDFDLYFMGISGHKKATLSAAAHDIDIDYRADTGPTRTAYIKEVRISLWRVS